MRRLAAAVLACCASSPARAADWYRVATNDLGIVYVDADTVAREGDRATGWQYAIWHRPPAPGMARARSHIVVDCRDLSFRVVAHILYDEAGRARPYRDNRGVRPAAPDSAAMLVGRFLCGADSDAVRLNGVSPEADARSRER